jgi:hypothetical protein
MMKPVDARHGRPQCWRTEISRKIRMALPVNACEDQPHMLARGAANYQRRQSCLISFGH